MKTQPQDTNSRNLSTGKLLAICGKGVLEEFILPLCFCLNRLRGMLDKGEAVKNFVNALLQLANPDMIFKVMGAI